MTPPTRPPGLAPGARAAVVAPSGPAVEERLAAGPGILRGWDLDPVAAPHVLDRHPGFPYAWCDPDVSAVLCSDADTGALTLDAAALV